MGSDQYSFQILVVVDNSADYLSVVENQEEYILKPDVIYARTFQEAKNKLRESKFDIIFLDLALAKYAEDLIYELQVISHGTPVIVQTAIDLEFANSDLKFVAEPEDFKLFIGTNSRDVKEADFKLTAIASKRLI